MSTITLDIENCEQCPYHVSAKIYTPDSFENVRKVRCERLQKDVYGYLDWYDEATIPNYCPLINLMA